MKKQANIRYFPLLNKMINLLYDFAWLVFKRLKLLKK